MLPKMSAIRVSMLGSMYIVITFFFKIRKERQTMQNKDTKPDVCTRLNIRTLTPEDIFSMMNFKSMRTCYQFINDEAKKGGFILKRTGRLLRIDEESFVRWYRNTN